LAGIDNTKFHPIIRRVQNINIVLSPPFTEVRPAKYTVEKLLREINPANVYMEEKGSAFFKFHSLIAGQPQQQDPNAQQSMKTKSPMSVITQQKEKIKLLMKFE
jgi:hypothetical protein